MFLRGVNEVIVIANLESPPTLAPGVLVIPLAVLLLGIVIWAVVPVRFFLKAPRDR